MNKDSLIRLACALTLSTASLPVLAEALAIRLGAWEVSSTLAEGQAPSVVRACVTKADLTQFVHGPDTIEDDPCRPTGEPRSNRRRWAISMTCQDGSQMHAEFTAERPERIRGALVRIGGRNTLSHRAQMTGRWLGGDCSAVR